MGKKKARSSNLAYQQNLDLTKHLKLRHTL